MTLPRHATSATLAQATAEHCHTQIPEVGSLPDTGDLLAKVGSPGYGLSAVELQKTMLGTSKQLQIHRKHQTMRI